MNEWQQVVSLHHGQSDAAQQFIKDAKRHISSYRARRVAESQSLDPKDVAEQLVALREMLEETGMALMTADKQLVSYARQGSALRGSTKPLPSFMELGQTLMNIGFGIDEIMQDVAPDLDLRRGSLRHNSRWQLLHDLRRSYAHRFDWSGKIAEPAFTEIMESLLGDLGLPAGDLARELRQATPPD